MIAATVTPPTSGATSLRDLINAVTFQISPLATGRVFGINLQWVSGTINVYYRNNPAAGDEGYVLDTNNRSMFLGHKPHLNLSLDEVFLGGSSTPSVRVVAYPSAAGSDDVNLPPIPLAGLALWLKADAIVGLADNDPVATWLDSSGSSNNATQGTAAAKPLYKTGIVNGKPVVRFDITDDAMDTPNNVFGAAPISIFVVYSAQSVVTARRAICSTTAVGANFLIGPYNNAYSIFNNAFITDGAVSAGVFKLNTYIDTGASATFWLDQVSIGSNVAAITPGAIGMGKTGPGFALEPLGGDIAEVIAYNVDQTPNRIAIENYLKAKYNI